MANLIQLTAADVKKWLNPTGKTGNGAFNFGTGYTMTESDVQGVADTIVGSLFAELPERYRQALRRIEGEVLVGAANQGQTQAQVGLFPATNVTMYKNIYIAYDARTPREVYQVTADTEDGAITFTEPLGAGDIVYADYNHTAGARFLELRNLALDLIAEHYSVFLPWLGDNEKIAKYATIARAKILQGVSIEAVDNLNLFKETKSDRSSFQTTAFNRW